MSSITKISNYNKDVFFAIKWFLFSVIVNVIFCRCHWRCLCCWRCRDVAVNFLTHLCLACDSLATYVTRVTRFKSHFHGFPIWLPRGAERTKGGSETQTHLFDYLQGNRENKRGSDLSRRGAIYPWEERFSIVIDSSIRGAHLFQGWRPSSPLATSPQKSAPERTIPPTIVMGCLLCVFTIETRGGKFFVFAVLLSEIPQGYIISKERSRWIWFRAAWSFSSKK